MPRDAMPRVLHLFNVFGALTERALLDYTLGLQRAGFDLTIGCETAAGEAPFPPAYQCPQTPSRHCACTRGRLRFEW